MDAKALEPRGAEKQLSHRTIQHVTVTELYDEGWCVLRWQLDGEVPEDCTCDKIGNKPSSETYKRLWHSGEMDIAHGLPPSPDVASLSSKTLELIDKFTAEDQKVYSRVVLRLIDDMCDVQRQTGAKLICPARITSLKKSVKHIEGLPGQIEEQVAACPF